MKKLILLSLLSVPLSAQIFGHSQSVVSTTVDPFGACVGNSLQYNRSNGKLWGCQSSVWTLVTSGGSVGSVTLAGDVTGPSGSNVIAAGAVTSSKIATGASVTNIGYTPLNPANNLSDVGTVATALTNLGLGTGSSPVFAGAALRATTAVLNFQNAAGSTTFMQLFTDNGTGTLHFTGFGKSDAVLIEGATGNVTLNGPTTKIPALQSTTGTRYLCISTTGVISSSATACSGT